MEIEELWTAGLSECFTGEFDSVRALFLSDQNFAEMCRDFVEIHKLSVLADAQDPHVHECLTGLKEEILSHYSDANDRRYPLKHLKMN
ncbi:MULTISPECIES: hypothetical protein [unclassified Ruegeria]|uniref:hypothetical protein n=1 Tax=unclassified Ruegeria TaxID=2625375 RepID=UPI001491FD74|nr:MULTISPECIES: hypothetical protein [unclassified Ruegeria]NOD78499.1 hypothetical protein [Ruegeria sp. HKCCD4332]UUV08585.1 hypothetical protein NOR97_19945 [Ruegeria sp. YS9]